jgi:hypothetical protein
MSQSITPKIIAVETPNRSIPFAVSNRQGSLANSTSANHLVNQDLRDFEWITTFFRTFGTAGGGFQMIRLQAFSQIVVYLSEVQS